MPVCLSRSQFEEDQLCHAFGGMLHELKSNRRPRAQEYSDEDDSSGQPASKMTNGKFLLTNNIIPSLQKLGFRSAISLLVQNLSNCQIQAEGELSRPRKAYTSVEEANANLHKMLLHPDLVLFDASPTAMANSNVNNNNNNNNYGGPSSPSYTLQFRKDKLYGRETEVSLFSEAFCRVSSGNNEALFLSGYSGVGKSKLFQSVMAQVEIAGGYVVTQKFDATSKERPLLDTISMFNDLCLIILERSSPPDLMHISEKLLQVFGSNSAMLARLLPNIYLLCPDFWKPVHQEERNMDQANFSSICFTLQLFMRVVSSKMHPTVFFLDDLQWADKSSLDLILSILSDFKGSGCFFFVGSYRDNEVSPDHSIFSLMAELDLCSVPMTCIQLTGLSLEDFNFMVSDALLLLPRISMSLSNILFQKTKGNPLYAMEFMRSLVDRKLLQFSLRERQWVWDEDKIISEDITDNTLYLLCTKMKVLPESMQTTLKVLSCLGTKVNATLVGYLSASPQYSQFCHGLVQAVESGFVEKVGMTFKFVHDNVQEAAYSLIQEDEKEQFHFDLGMALYTASEGQDVEDLIFTIAYQINHGFGSCVAPDIVGIVGLNLEAGSKAIDRSDYASARPYLNMAMSILPHDHWTNHYNVCHRLHFLAAKAASSCGFPEEANAAIQKLLSESRSIEDKLEAYSILVLILHDRQEVVQASIICTEVLTELGEVIPESFDQLETATLIMETSKFLDQTSTEAFFGPNRIDRKLYFILKFYSLLSYTRPEVTPFINCKMCRLSINQGVCEYTIMSYLQFAAMVCSIQLMNDISGACRVGRTAMSVLKANDLCSSSKLSYICYGFFASNVEPLQSCADMLRRGYEIGISVGDISSALLNSVHHMRISMLAGANLQNLLQECDYYLTMANKYEIVFSKTLLLLSRECISVLIGKNETSNPVTEHALIGESVYFQRAVQSYWLGFTERCQHYVEKMLQMKKAGHLRPAILFYHGLNSSQMMKRSNASKHQVTARNALAAMKSAAKHSEWNYKNKFLLLEAETFSFEGKDEKARLTYAAAIEAARSSKFVHEEGLAYELAGLHHLKYLDTEKARELFLQAKECYTVWGSTMKVESIQSRIDLL